MSEHNWVYLSALHTNTRLYSTHSLHLGVGRGGEDDCDDGGGGGNDDDVVVSSSVKESNEWLVWS